MRLLLAGLYPIWAFWLLQVCRCKCLCNLNRRRGGTPWWVSKRAWLQLSHRANESEEPIQKAVAKDLGYEMLGLGVESFTHIRGIQSKFGISTLIVT